MADNIRKLVLLLQLFSAIVVGNSACSNYISYMRNTETNEIFGIIEIPSPPRHVNLTVHVDMSFAGNLPSKYRGSLKLERSKEDAVDDVKHGRALRYELHFPVLDPIPNVHRLTFNDERMCSAPRASGSTVTTVSLSHTLYPNDAVQLSAGDDLPSFPEVQRPPRTTTHRPIYRKPTTPRTLPTFAPPTPPPTTAQPIFTPPIFTPPTFPPTTASPAIFGPPPSLPQIGAGNIFLNPMLNGNQDCGRSSVSANINRLVFRGTATSHGQWPWLVAIFVIKTNSGLNFQCAGSLVSNTHIITAAHCFQSGTTNMPAAIFHVSIGRYRLRDWRESGSENRNVAEYKLHPDYDVRKRNADADLAIIVMNERVEYTETIKPICLWNGSPELDGVVGRFGYVVGWGEDENGNKYVEEPRMSREPIVTQEDCLRSHASFVSATSRRSFCAGARNGSGPCNGDSGSGLIIRDRISGRYQLRGIVSLSLSDSVTGSCDLTHFTVYSDVAKHLQWVRQQIST